MENPAQAIERTQLISIALMQKFSKFKKIVESHVNKSTENITLLQNYIGTKYFKVTFEPENVVENNYNNSNKSHYSYTDENGDLHFILYESYYKTDICFAKGDEKGMALYNAFMAITTVPSKESAKMFKEALEAY